MSDQPLPDNVHAVMRAHVLQALESDQAGEPELFQLFFDFCHYRLAFLKQRVRERLGTNIVAGPFQGMRFDIGPVGSCLLPKLLGTYEQELHPVIRKAVRRGYKRIINLGCAEGLYAVGFKRLMPDTEIIAVDILPEARAKCQAMAELNGVELVISDGLAHSDLARLCTPDTLIWSDIEGAEEDLLDPEAVPALKTTDMVVELHETAIEALPPRYKASHDVKLLMPGVHGFAWPGFLDDVSDIDLALLQWEMRYGPLPWAVMTSKA
ncbi:MAG: hypothetical protein ACPGOY_05120 [Rhodospirillaceae bacterium]